jgi:hypothetical protein
MFKYFSFRKTQKEKETGINSLIVTKLDRIIELLEQQKEKGEGKNFHFDHVQIDYLENIVFHLDNLEIDELSGKLIIGNNITSSEDLANPIIQKINKADAKQEAMSDTDLAQQTKIVKTEKGYRYQNHS